MERIIGGNLVAIVRDIAFQDLNMRGAFFGVGCFDVEKDGF
jgi:hypothetical protein